MSMTLTLVRVIGADALPTMAALIVGMVLLTWARQRTLPAVVWSHPHTQRSQAR